MGNIIEVMMMRATVLAKGTVMVKETVIKSAIAQSVAELCCSAKPSSLAACFFFSCNVAERNTKKYLAATLAYQIAVSIPVARPFIENAVQQDPCIFSCSLAAQFTKLIAEPLSKLLSWTLLDLSG